MELGDHAIQLAASNGQLEVVVFLLQNGSKYMVDSNTIFQWACTTDRLEIIEHLIGRGIYYTANKNLIHLALKNSRSDIVKFLHNEEMENCPLTRNLEYGKNNIYPIKLASANNYLKVIDFLIRNESDCRAYRNCTIQMTSPNGDLEIVKVLAKKKKSILSISIIIL